MSNPAWHRVLLLLTLAVGVAMAPAARAVRPFEVRDSIQMADFTEAPTLSPDGRHFVTVTQRGVLPEGVTEATLWLFETAAVRRAIADGSKPTPRPIARLAGAINTGNGVLGAKGLVMNLRWTPDNSAVLFLGRKGQDNRQLFRASLDGREALAMTATTQDVVDYAIADSRILLLVAPDASTQDAWNARPAAAPDVVIGTGLSLSELFFPNQVKTARNLPTRFELWSIKGGEVAPVLRASGDAPISLIGSYNLGGLVASPDGRRVVSMAHADEVPVGWSRYETSGEPDTRAFLPHAADDDPQADYGRALQYQVIDIEKGERHPLLDAPLADWQRGGKHALQTAWSPDGRYVAVSGTYLPLDLRTGKGSLAACGAAVIDTVSGTLQCLLDGRRQDPASVQGLAWSEKGRLTLRLGDGKPLDFQQRNGHWQQVVPVAAKAPAALPLELSIRQALNDPPTLFAKDPKTGQERRIFDPNPQFADVAMASVTPFYWKDAHGRTINGGLVKPPDFVAGKRYPLVIQTHNFRPRRFFRTGISDTASAGRALAARGMLVLQVDEPDDDYMFTPREATENGTNVYVAAIDKLASEGLVDPSKVGIAGYSRMAFYVTKALVESPERFAAAVVANGDPGSLLGYYAGITGAIDEDRWTGLFAGAQPYGEGFGKWIANAPGLRTDRITAPVLIAAGDPGHLLPLWGLYAPLRQQGKPVELQYIRGGQHNLVKPLEILAHQELLVDWFDFWLAGRVDPASGKAEQYRRWKSWQRGGMGP